MFVRTLSLLLFVLAAGCGRESQRLNAPVPTEGAGRAQTWMLRQRAYPFSEIPPHARRDAFHSMRAMSSRHPSSSDQSRWTSIGPAPVGVRESWRLVTGRVTAVAISPTNSNVIIVGSSSGGIWRTVDGGSTFTPVSDDQVDLAVGSLAIAPSNPNVIYAGMGEFNLGTGILRSTDAGATWNLATSRSFPPRSSTRKLLVDPGDENVLWLAQAKTLSDSGSVALANGLLKSVDGGLTWTRVFDGVVRDFMIGSADGATLFIGATRAERAGTGGIYRSTDRGATWQLVYQGFDDPSFPPSYFLTMSSGRLFGATLEEVGGEVKYRIVSSTDGGTQWSVVGEFPRNSRILYLEADPKNANHLFIGGVQGQRSTDGGRTWTPIATHVDQHAIAFDPADSSRVWLGNDGGLFRSDDGGATFLSLGALLPIVQFYSVNAHPTDPEVLMGGTQDNGIERRISHTREWSEFLGGDFGTVLFDRDEPSRILSAYLVGNLYRWRDNGASAPERITTPETFGESFNDTRIGFLGALAQGPDGTVWFGTWRIFASSDFGTTWTPPAGVTDLTRGEEAEDVLSAIGVSASDANVLYTGSEQGRVMITQDRALTWTDITPPVNRYVTSIAVDRTSPATAYLGFSGYRAARVYKTTTFGASWSDASTGLPDVPVNAIHIDHADPRTLYAGTDIGVFRSDTAGADWYLFNNGMPPVIVTSFTTTANGRLIAGTYGRGAYMLSTGEDGTRRRPVRR